MDKLKLLIYLFVLIIIVDGINCDSHCDCSLMMNKQRFLQEKLHKIEFDKFNIESRLQRLEASKWYSTQSNDEITSKESDRQLTHDDKKEETRDNDRIASVEAKLAGTESLLKIGDINDTNAQQGTIQSEVLGVLEIKLASVSKQVNDTIELNNVNKVVLGNLAKKTLVSEKRIRMKFEASIKHLVEAILSMKY